MEIVVGVLMLVVGGMVAAFAMGAIAILGRRDSAGAGEQAGLRTDRERVAASLLFHVINAGGASPDEALRQIRRGTGIAAAPVAGIDITTWGERYASSVSQEERMGLLETAVRLVSDSSKVVPLPQYAALLDLSFGLGFQTDALARLRQQYGFRFADPATARGGETPLFRREDHTREELARTLGVSETASRQELSAAYRRLAAVHHPDRFHTASTDEQAAAARFIQITRAYEELLFGRTD